MTAKKKQKKGQNPTLNTANEVTDIIVAISKWQIEANSAHNDAWTRSHYEGLLNKIRQHVCLEESSEPRLVT